MVFSIDRRWSSSEVGEREAIRESMSSSVRRASSVMVEVWAGRVDGGGIRADESSLGVVVVDMVGCVYELMGVSGAMIRWCGFR